jgi:hypothetical protein
LQFANGYDQESDAASDYCHLDSRRSADVGVPAIVVSSPSVPTTPAKVGLLLDERS